VKPKEPVENFYRIALQITMEFSYGIFLSIEFLVTPGFEPVTLA